jgi:hypothetical protein
LIIEEVWNTFGDLGAAVRATNRKFAEAAELAVMIGQDAYRVASLWALRPSAANRALVARYPQIFRSAFPGSSRRWVEAVTSGSAPPSEAGLVWLDPATGRVTEVRLRARG